MKRLTFLAIQLAAVTTAFLLLGASAARAQATGFTADIRSQDFDVSPGETVTGSFSVTSHHDTPITVRVYAADRVRLQEPVRDYPIDIEPGKEPRSLLPWFQFSPDIMDLQPGESRPVQFTISMPADNELSGSYWAVLLLENAAEPESVMTPVEGSDTLVAVQMVFRYGMSITTTVRNTEQVSGTFSAATTEAHQHGLIMRPVFHNKGNTIIRPRVWLDLRDSAGQSVARTEPTPTGILPDSRRELQLEINNATIPPGEYILMCIADYGGPNLVAAQARLTVQGTITPAPEVEEETESPVADAAEPAAGAEPAPRVEPDTDPPGLN